MACGVLTGRQRKLEFSLMEAGHTKFSPDWHFGLWKIKWRHTTTETLPEISSSVSRSSRNGHNLPQLVQDSEKPVVLYNWSAYFDEFFKKGTLMLGICITPHLNIPILSIPFV